MHNYQQHQSCLIGRPLTAPPSAHPQQEHDKATVPDYVLEELKPEHYPSSSPSPALAH